MLPEVLPDALPALPVTYRGTYVRRITTTGSGAVTGTVEEVLVAGSASSATAGAAAEDAVALPPRTAMRTKVAAVENTAAA